MAGCLKGIATVCCGESKPPGPPAPAKAAPAPVDNVRAKPVATGRQAHSFVVTNQGRIRDQYNLDSKKLGNGSYGTVSKATHKVDSAIRAIKTINKAQAGRTAKELERLQTEINIMKMMDHPGIIKLYETFEDQKNIYLVMELCTGGELFDRICEAGRFTEPQAAVVMKQMIGAVFYMHERQVCHRDLKPENFLFQSKDDIEKNRLKLIDFGLSINFKKGHKFKTKAGTPYYVAPQVLEGVYDELCDVWSAGVIMYVLLCGYPPFYAETDAGVVRKVRKGEYEFRRQDWQNVSDDAQNLIVKMLKFNPRQRCTAREALNHVWIKDKAPRGTNVPLNTSLVNNLKNFRSRNKLQKAALHVIASLLSEDKIKSLRELFQHMDDNGDGMLSVGELKEGLKKAGVRDIPADLQTIIEDIDSDRSGLIDYTEFLAAAIDKRQYLQEDVCWSAFCVFDRNSDGKISQEELRNVLANQGVQGMMGNKVAQDIMSEVDQDGNGEIDFEEFMHMMRKL